MSGGDLVKGHISVISPIWRSAALSVFHSKVECGKENVKSRKYSGRDVFPRFPTKQCQRLCSECTANLKFTTLEVFALTYANIRLA